jgi:hypothetical protein
MTCIGLRPWAYNPPVNLTLLLFLNLNMSSKLHLILLFTGFALRFNAPHNLLLYEVKHPDNFTSPLKGNFLKHPSASHAPTIGYGPGPFTQAKAGDHPSETFSEPLRCSSYEAARHNHSLRCPPLALQVMFYQLAQLSTPPPD